MHGNVAKSADLTRTMSQTNPLWGRLASTPNC